METEGKKVELHLEICFQDKREDAEVAIEFVKSVRCLEVSLNSPRKHDENRGQVFILIWCENRDEKLPENSFEA
jgi:hypothetical protein